ncbi:MAG: beta-ketoacyl-[acyl-carrier-protein] synthase II [Candidatus Nephrothrix sp. EaCA]|nr:MAG: beta-ketoacyl-[acyl-carrier-protein] synthase II [Candidatus Nephrothrix sp. EaCA]
MLKRVVITGMGALTPIGNTLPEYWEALKEGKSGAAPITRFDASRFKTQFACELKNFDSENFFDRKEARKMDAFTQYAVVCADEAIKHSRLPLDSMNKDRAGVIWGSGIGGLFTFQEEVKAFVKGNGIPRFNPFFIPKMIPDISAGMISIKYGFRGPNFVTVSACASSTNAIYDAFTYIRLGKADVIVSGGSEAAVFEAGIGGFNGLKALSERNDSPATASRPYDRNRDGFVLGEGAGALVLEEYEFAKKRGASIYGEIIGGGMSADAYHLTAPHPEGAGIILVMKNALEEAGIKPEDVDYINTHGTSTPMGDFGELKAIQNVFGEHSYKLNISSTKSMTGHLLGAAGAIETLACLLALNEGIIPPTINYFDNDDELDVKLNLTVNKAQRRQVNIAVSNTFGFGGHNVSIVLKKAE